MCVILYIYILLGIDVLNVCNVRMGVLRIAKFLYLNLSTLTHDVSASSGMSIALGCIALTLEYGAQTA